MIECTCVSGSAERLQGLEFLQEEPKEGDFDMVRNGLLGNRGTGGSSCSRKKAVPGGGAQGTSKGVSPGKGKDGRIGSSLKRGSVGFRSAIKCAGDWESLYFNAN